MHVVVLGAGYAGVSLLSKLETRLADDVDLTLVDERDSHLVQHLIHRVVREPALTDRLTVPLDAICERATHRQARVVDIHPDAGRVELDDGTLEYDVGAVCLGARTAYYGLPGVEEHATPLKRLSDAEQIREQALPLLAENGRVVVGGAGLSGIQIAGELAALRPQQAAEDDDTDPPDDENTADGALDVVLLEQRERVPPGFPESFQDAVADELDTRGVTVRTGVTVESADKDGIDTDETVIDYDQFVWTGGIAGGQALDGGRPRVRSTLRLGDRTFGLGDAVSVVDANGEQVPASAQTAVREAETVATNVERLVDYQQDSAGFEPRLDRYEYESAGWVVTVGDGTVAQVGSRVLRGAPARTMKAAIGAQHLGTVGEIEGALEFARNTIWG